MQKKITNKRKIFNDPVYGFIAIPDDLTYDIIEHPYFQRLRRIKQLGLSSLVYPGALHTRFQHALGSMHLMTQAIDVLRSKGFIIDDEEAQAAKIAILLHDIGHGPFSHSLENSIICNLTHEDLSELFFYRLNEEFDGKITLAIKIFKNTYHKKFLHQLVSSQLDMDRLDYLKRDSFYTGVSEGVISTERIIKMLSVADDKLVVESKGIYSIENFIISRRLMYWQVYLHKTSISADNLLDNILKRVKQNISVNNYLKISPSFQLFLEKQFSKKDFIKNPALLEAFAELDDTDITYSLKIWTKSDDRILSILSDNLINRKLFAIELQNESFDIKYVQTLKDKTKKKLNLNDDEVEYFVFTDKITSSIYNPKLDKINILFRNKKILDIADASDQLNVSVLSKIITKHFLCYPKQIR